MGLASVSQHPQAAALGGQSLLVHRQGRDGARRPHVGVDMIWPLGVIIEGLTATKDSVIKQCLNTLQQTHAGTGFMHEAFHKDAPQKFTRSWFAWANTIFGEFVLKTFHECPHLLR